MSAFDRFASFSPTWATPSPGRAAVTPSDLDPLPFTTRALRITTGGTVRAAHVDGGLINFTAASGERIPGQFTRVFATGTTATGIIAEK